MKKNLLVKVLSVSLACLMAAGSLSGLQQRRRWRRLEAKPQQTGNMILTFWTYSDMVLNDQGKLLDKVGLKIS